MLVSVFRKVVFMPVLIERAFDGMVSGIQWLTSSAAEQMGLFHVFDYLEKLQTGLAVLLAC